MYWGPIYASHTIGGMHSHLPPTILAIKGLAGSDELLMIGQFATQPWVTPSVGSFKSQQLVSPKAYFTAVGIWPSSGEMSAVMVPARGQFGRGSQAPCPPAVASRLLLSALAAGIE